jgi:hypothetical protein
MNLPYNFETQSFFQASSQTQQRPSIKYIGPSGPKHNTLP